MIDNNNNKLFYNVIQEKKTPIISVNIKQMKI